MLVAIFRKTGDGLENWLEDDTRQLLPLDRAFGVIEFSQPGRYLICASIVIHDRNPRSKRETCRSFNCLTETNSGGEFGYHLTNRHEYKAWESHNISFLTHHEKVPVFVDQQFFAAKPKELWWEYVNLWHARTPRDQCMFRRRAILAIPKTLPIIFYAFVVPMISLFMAFLLLSIGRRYIAWKELFHPTFNLNTDFEKITIKAEALELNSGDSKMYWNKSTKDGKLHGQLFNIMFTPLNWFILSIIPTLAAIYVKSPSLHFRLMVFLNAFTIMLMYSMSGLAIIILLSLITELISTPEKKARKEKEDKVRKELALEKEKRKERTRLMQLYGERFDPLTCTTGPREATLAAVPKSHRTLYLLYLDTKFKVCKPFARSKR